MSLRARMTAPEKNGGAREDSHMVATYRAKLLEEIDLAEMSSLAAADRRPGWSAYSATSSAAKDRSSRPSNAPS